MTSIAIPDIRIDPAKYATRLTTTVRRLIDAKACEPRLAHLLIALGIASRHLSREQALDTLSPTQLDAPINLLTVLEHNGVDDCLWVLCATEQNCDVVARLMAADFAEQALPAFEAYWSGNRTMRDGIAVARAYAIGRATDAERISARAALADLADLAARATLVDVSTNITTEIITAIQQACALTSVQAAA